MNFIQIIIMVVLQATTGSAAAVSHAPQGSSSTCPVVVSGEVRTDPYTPGCDTQLPKAVSVKPGCPEREVGVRTDEYVPGCDDGEYVYGDGAFTAR